MDFDMPIMDGIEATKRIKQADPSQVVIGCTAASAVTKEQRALFDGIVGKPVAPDELKRTLHQLAPID